MPTNPTHAQPIGAKMKVLIIRGTPRDFLDMK